eukprot:INCI14688.1.p1 GENE.INCI14688.1~~INCI14688.1.p1  ORF type:complete len:491 (+),score=53.96 INCI14688.1:362-1834(+)
MAAATTAAAAATATTASSLGFANSSCEHSQLPHFYNSSLEDTSWQWAAILWTGLIASCLSLVGSLVILLSYCAFHKFRNTNYRYITAIALCDVCVSVAHLAMTGGMEGALFQTGSTPGVARGSGAIASAPSSSSAGVDPDDLWRACASTLCYVTAVIQQYFHLAEYLWISALAFTIYLTLVRNIAVSAKFERWMHAIIWGVSAVVTAIPGATSCYGSSGHWCWVKSDGICADVQWAALYGWLLLLYAFNIFCYISAEIALCRNPALRAVSGRLRLYLLAFLVINLPTVVHLSLGLAYHGQTIFGLFWLMSLTEPLKGFVNAAVFGFNGSTIGVYREGFCRKHRNFGERPKTLSELVTMDSNSLRQYRRGEGKLLAQLRRKELDDEEDADVREVAEPASHFGSHPNKPYHHTQLRSGRHSQTLKGLNRNLAQQPKARVVTGGVGMETRTDVASGFCEEEGSGEDSDGLYGASVDEHGFMYAAMTPDTGESI